MTADIVTTIWVRRRQQTDTVAKATKKREQPAIELSDEEWQLLLEGADLERRVRIAAESS